MLQPYRPCASAFASRLRFCLVPSLVPRTFAFASCLRFCLLSSDWHKLRIYSPFVGSAQRRKKLNPPPRRKKHKLPPHRNATADFITGIYDTRNTGKFGADGACSDLLARFALRCDVVAVESIGLMYNISHPLPFVNRKQKTFNTFLLMRFNAYTASPVNFQKVHPQTMRPLR